MCVCLCVFVCVCVRARVGDKQLGKPYLFIYRLFNKLVPPAICHAPRAKCTHVMNLERWVGNTTKRGVGDGGGFVTLETTHTTSEKKSTSHYGD